MAVLNSPSVKQYYRNGILDDYCVKYSISPSEIAQCLIEEIELLNEEIDRLESLDDEEYDYE